MLEYERLQKEARLQEEEERRQEEKYRQKNQEYHSCTESFKTVDWLSLF
jgi:hypothetical protein